MGRRTALPAARSRRQLRRRLYQAGQGAGHPGSARCTSVALTTGLHRARHRLDPAGVPGSRDHRLGNLASPNPRLVPGLLSRVKNSSLPGEGLPGTTVGPAAGHGTNRRRSAGRRAAPALPATGSVRSAGRHSSSGTGVPRRHVPTAQTPRPVWSRGHRAPTASGNPRRLRQLHRIPGSSSAEHALCPVTLGLGWDSR